MRYVRPFTAFLVGGFFAGFGGWINFLAILNIATWRFNAQPIDLVLLSAAFLLPSVALTRPIAQICNRHRSTRVMTLALGVTLCTTLALIYVGRFDVFLAIVAIKSAALGFVNPAEMEYVTTTLAPDEHADAFRMISLTQNIAKICAPAAGAVLSVWLGDQHTMFASLILIAAAMACLSLSVRPRTTLSNAHAPGLSKAISESAANVSDSNAATRAAEVVASEAPARTSVRSTLAPLLACFAVTTAVGGAVNNQFPLMLRNQGFDPSVLGVVVSAAAIGGVLGSLLYPSRANARVGLRNLVVPSIATCLMFIAMGIVFRMPLTIASALLACAFFGTGLVGSRFRVASRLFISEQLNGHVSSATTTLQSAGLLTQFFAPFLGALLTSHLTNSGVFLLLGIGGTIAIAGVALYFGIQRPRSTTPSALTRPSES